MNKKRKRALQPGLSGCYVIMACFCVAAALMKNYYLAAVGSGLTAIMVFSYLHSRQRNRREIHAFMQESFQTADFSGRGTENPLPMALIRLNDGGVVWANEKFVSVTGLKERIPEETVDRVLPGMRLDWLMNGKNEYPYDVSVGRRRYRIYGTLIHSGEHDGMLMGMIYLSDLTEMYQVRDEYIRSRPVVAIIMVDNYEELTMNQTESAISTMDAEINDIITAWAEGYHGLLRKAERNRYLLVFEKRMLDDAIATKFPVVENVHAIVSPSGLTASVSIGVGVDGVDFEECYNFAALSIEMALSRGGDQAVIKDRLNFSFYGGRAKEADRRSKVRSRVTANSLMELIGNSSQVFIMGHRNADMDAVGAAMGVACLCRKKNKKFFIVLDQQRNSAKSLLNEIKLAPEYANCFTSGEEAILLADSRSTLVVVDTNRPDQVECLPLLDTINRVCVIDHHRRAADYIEPVVVNLHEPFASSASELVTELIQYAVEKKDVLPIESKSLLAGIFLDTKSFNVRVGERTFEAAAVLRSMGADPTEVKKLLQTNFEETLARYRIIESARLYRNEIAIAALESGTTRVLAAQAADEMLNISGITCSIVLYPDAGKVNISARSMGDVNVQMILEPLGGGGNTATAGAQVAGKTVTQVLEDLTQSIEKYYEG